MDHTKPRLSFHQFLIGCRLAFLCDYSQIAMAFRTSINNLGLERNLFQVFYVNTKLFEFLLRFNLVFKRNFGVDCNIW